MTGFHSSTFAIICQFSTNFLIAFIHHSAIFLSIFFYLNLVFQYIYRVILVSLLAVKQVLSYFRQCKCSSRFAALGKSQENKTTKFRGIDLTSALFVYHMHAFQQSHLIHYQHFAMPPFSWFFCSVFLTKLICLFLCIHHLLWVFSACEMNLLTLPTPPNTTASYPLNKFAWVGENDHHSYSITLHLFFFFSLMSQDQVTFAFACDNNLFSDVIKTIFSSIFLCMLQAIFCFIRFNSSYIYAHLFKPNCLILYSLFFLSCFLCFFLFCCLLYFRLPNLCKK